jgi:hypothetical protein
MSHSLRSLLTASSQVSLGRPLPSLHYRPGLAPHYTPVPQEASSGHDQTISTGVGPIFPQLVPLQLYLECLNFRLYLFLYAHESITTYASRQHSVAGHVVSL